MEIKKISENIWEIPIEGDMNVPGRIFANEKLLEKIKEDRTLEQIRNVAKLPGILNASFVMPDAHQGYGFSIGGVAGFDLEKGIISPGGVGYDINCGVRVLTTGISFKKFKEKISEINKEINKEIPSGVGNGNLERLSEEDLNEILVKGVKWAVENDFGEKDDLKNCEENGCVKNANPKNISQKAKARGKPQLGTLGAGNHFIEIQKIEKIFDEKTANKFKLKLGEVIVMIHCGSRGLGHQVASDYIQEMEKSSDIEPLPNKELIYAKINSELGQKYFSAMNCAINYAFCNRQIIMDKIRKIIQKYFPSSKPKLLYDVAHNIAKIEEHLIEGKRKDICIHRKGATRAFDKQPVIIPGSMGTSSYILVGTKKSEELSFSSTAHGAGRVMSRSNAKQTLNGEEIKKSLEEKGINVEVNSIKGLAEEAPEVYKDIHEVIEISDSLGLAKKVAKVVPVGIIKG